MAVEDSSSTQWKWSTLHISGTAMVEDEVPTNYPLWEKNSLGRSTNTPALSIDIGGIRTEMTQGITLSKHFKETLTEL